MKKSRFTEERMVASGWPRPYFPRCSRKEALRIWVPGCASGEEVHSIAIAT